MMEKKTKKEEGVGVVDGGRDERRSLEGLVLDGDEEAPATVVVVDAVGNDVERGSGLEAEIGSLSAGLISAWGPKIDGLQDTLNEITEAQKELLGTIAGEKAAIVDSADLAKIADVLARVPLYTQKLDGIRKDMTQLQDKSKKLKKRVDKLALKRAHEQAETARKEEAARQRELKLAARPVGESLMVKFDKKDKKKRAGSTTPGDTTNAVATSKSGSRGKLGRSNASSSSLHSAEPEPQIVVVNPGPKRSTSSTSSSSRGTPIPPPSSKGARNSS